MLAIYARCACVLDAHRVVCPCKKCPNGTAISIEPKILWQRLLLCFWPPRFNFECETFRFNRRFIYNIHAHIHIRAQYWATMVLLMLMLYASSRISIDRVRIRQLMRLKRNRHTNIWWENVCPGHGSSLTFRMAVDLWTSASWSPYKCLRFHSIKCVIDFRLNSFASIPISSYCSLGTSHYSITPSVYTLIL